MAWPDRQKGNMKINSRDVGLLAVGFIIGAVVVTSPTFRPMRPPAAAVLASLPPRSITITNIEWQLPPNRVVRLPQSLDSVDPLLYPRARRSMHLIDTHYKPDVNLDDMK